MANPLIMVVDDDVDVADSIASVIKGTKRYDVITANSGKQALELLDKNRVFFGMGGNRIRMVLLDIKMPEMDGLQLLDKIRCKYGEDIGVSMLTAYEDVDKWDRATSGYVVNYIKKPFTPEDVISTIDNYCAGKEGKMILDTFEKHLQKKEEFKKSS